MDGSWQFLQLVLPDCVYVEARSSVSVVAVRPLEALILAVVIWMVCTHQRVTGEERLSSAELISSNDPMSKSQLLLQGDQRGGDHRGPSLLRDHSLFSFSNLRNSVDSVFTDFRILSETIQHTRRISSVYYL